LDYGPGELYQHSTHTGAFQGMSYCLILDISLNYAFTFMYS